MEKRERISLKQIVHEGEEIFDGGALFFDDEPIEDILYKEGWGKGPTPANLFLRGRGFVRMISEAYGKGRGEDLISSAQELAESGEEISFDMCRQLIEVMSIFVPACPYPVMKYDMLPLGSLLRKLWQEALLGDDAAVITKAGFVLSHWAENHGLHGESREVLCRLRLLYRDLGDKPEEAGSVNGIGFTYLLEKKWKEAIPFFEEAAKEFRKLDLDFRYANARCNYWQCRFELDDLENLVETEQELKELSATLQGEDRWHERKPLILRAKLEEKRNNIDKAIIMVERAIKVTTGNETRYPDFDEEYLERLRNNGKE